MKASVRRGPRAQQKDATRARLLKVARRIFTQSGYEGTAVGELCKRAKVTHGALYHHFPAGKQELFAAVVAEVFAGLAERVSAAVAGHVGWEGVKAACNAYLDACAEQEVQVIIFRDGPRVLGAEFEALDGAANEPMVTALLRGWMAQGLLRPLPVVMLARLLGALFEEAGALLVEASDPVHARAQVDALLGGWLAGLRRLPSDRPSTLATDRLVLLPWCGADLATLGALLSTEEARRFLNDSDEVSADWMSRAVAASEERFARGELGMFVARNGEQAAVGIVGFSVIGGRTHEELVITVAPDFRRRGFGYELAEVVVCEARARGNPNVRASVGKGNAALTRLLEKLGFIRWAERGEAVEYVARG